MNNPIPRSQIDSVANRIMQMVLAILPIGAGIVALLTQQSLGLKTTLMIIAIWLSILALSISALINLQIFRFPATQTVNEENRLTRIYRNGIHWFTTGVILLMVSPFTLISGYWEPIDIPIRVYTNDIVISQVATQPTTIYSTAAITNLSNSQQELTINLGTDAGGCLVLGTDAFSLNLHPGFSQVIGWNTGFTQTCAPGNYLIVIEVSSKAHVVYREYMTIKINPTD